MTSNAELACVYSALILADDEIAVTVSILRLCSKLSKILNYFAKYKSSNNNHCTFSVYCSFYSYLIVYFLGREDSNNLESRQC